jgi:hypothetical protein
MLGVVSRHIGLQLGHLFSSYFYHTGFIVAYEVVAGCCGVKPSPGQRLNTVQCIVLMRAFYSS